MARKPVSQRQGTDHNDSREAAWAAMRKLKQFSIDDLEIATREKRRTLATYVASLRNGGYLELVGNELSSRSLRANQNLNHGDIYRLVKNVGIEAPRVRRDGSLVTAGRGRKNMWRVIKVMSEFDFHEVAMQASVDDVTVSRNEAKDYVGHLHKAGYLRLVRKSKPGTAARYKLIKSRFTGPKPPMIQRVKHVYDPNLRKVVWPREDQS